MTSAEKYYHSLLTFGVRPGLERIKMLLCRLGDPQKKLRCVHVAGTNGKGTTCTFIASVLQKAGYKTGLYTSPYIVDFRERIRVNGEMISPAELEDVTSQVKTEIEKLNGENIIITEFEAVTAAAFLYYESVGCDIVVLETGLGGRFDATNVIDEPIVSVITSISLDHVNVLGDTLGKIAYEKCGIIKTNRPVVTVKTQDPEAMTVIEDVAGKMMSDLTVADINDVEVSNESIEGTDIVYKGTPYFVPFPGVHQTDNCILALEAVDIIRQNGFEISDDDIKYGIASAKNPARCEILRKDPLVILDGCHNEGSAAALASVLNKHLKDRKIKAVMGMMADKAVDTVLGILCPYFDSVVTVTPSNPRAMKAEELCEKIKEHGVTSVIACGTPVDGVENAIASLAGDEVLIICGSLYLCADVRSCLCEY